jgi:hypothetical protein
MATSYPVAGGAEGLYRVTVDDPGPTYTLKYGEPGMCKNTVRQWKDLSLCTNPGKQCWEHLVGKAKGQTANLCLHAGESVILYHKKGCDGGDRDPSAPANAAWQYSSCQPPNNQSSAAVFDAAGGLRVKYVFEYLGPC